MDFSQSMAITVDGQPGVIRPDGMVQFGNDNLANVVFYKRPVLNQRKSQEAGRPIYESIEYVRIQHPGERDCADKPLTNVPDAPRRWPRQWTQYQASQEQIPDGTLVTALFVTEPEIAANLRGLGIHTVEQLARTSEHALDQIGMGAREWKNRAERFLSSALDGAEFHRMQRENDELKNKIEVMGNQMAIMKNQLDRLVAERGGVPPAMIPNKGNSVANNWQANSIATQEGSAMENTVQQSYAPPAQLSQVKARGWPKGKPRNPKTPIEG